MDSLTRARKNANRRYDNAALDCAKHLHEKDPSFPFIADIAMAVPEQFKDHSFPDGQSRVESIARRSGLPYPTRCRVLTSRIYPPRTHTGSTHHSNKREAESSMEGDDLAPNPDGGNAQ
eukprot:8728166-Karenia_brevis.AAC.1